MTCKIAISIINYRTADMTLDCVRSVLDDIGDIDARVVVVDNASGDGSADVIAGWVAAQPDDTPVTLVRSEANSGFSGGHNLGMGAVEADYYLVLNSDAVLRPGFLARILATADVTPEAGLVAPQIETDDGDVQTNCFRFQSPLGELERGARSGPVTRRLHRHVVSLQPPADPALIEWASFACILLRGEMTAAIGPMDEGYFLYFEDAEYCLRARRAGWTIVQDRSAVAVHYRGGSGPVKALASARKRLPPYFYASRSRFLYQAHGMAGLWMANLLWTLGWTLGQARRLIGRPLPPGIDREPRDIWINATRPLGRRHAPGE